jgi:hypothetical protein
MKNILVLLSLFILVLSANAQYKKEYGGGIGTTNYLGDIGGGSKEGRQNSPLDLKIKHERFSINGYTRLKLNKNFSVKGSLTYIRLVGKDANSSNPQRNARNLSFKSNVIELIATGEWNFYQQTKMAPRVAGLSKGGKKQRVDFRAYAFTGFGGVYFSSKAELLGKSYNLRKLKTEGVAYKPFTWAVPLGLGVSYTLNKKLRIGAELGYRITGSDWIDDVSGNYAYSYDEGAKGYANVKSGKFTDDDVRNAIIDQAKEIGAFDQTIYSDCKAVINICEKFQFINTLLDKIPSYEGTSRKVMIQALVDLLKYHKHRVDWKNYKIRFNEDLPLEETLTTETVEELVQQD